MMLAVPDGHVAPAPEREVVHCTFATGPLGLRMQCDARAACDAMQPGVGADPPGLACLIVRAP